MRLDHLETGPQVQVKRVAEHDLDADAPPAAPGVIALTVP